VRPRPKLAHLRAQNKRNSAIVERVPRIREVRQGPDGLLYLLTDEDEGAPLRIEPAP